MSEYQYYEFQAIDRPLDAADREALRELSTRARITPTSFTNHYEWGDFRGNPTQLMQRWFDLHLYRANWGSRQLMIRLPKRLVDEDRLAALIGDNPIASLHDAGDNLILDIARHEEGGYDDDWDDSSDSDWLPTLAPLRTDLLAGDLRVFYLLWLTELAWEDVEEDQPEPLPGLGPLTAALAAFANFFGIDGDLVAAAAERPAEVAPAVPSAEAAGRIVAALPEETKTAMLLRVLGGDPHVGHELRALVRTPAAAGAPSLDARTVGALRARAAAIRLAREQALAAKAEAERQAQEREAALARRARVDALARRGERVWRDVETEIERRNPKGYDAAESLLRDLKVLAEEQGTLPDFTRRLQAIGERHENKRKFIERLATIGDFGPQPLI